MLGTALSSGKSDGKGCSSSSWSRKLPFGEGSFECRAQFAGELSYGVMGVDILVSAEEFGALLSMNRSFGETVSPVLSVELECVIRLYRGGLLKSISDTWSSKRLKSEGVRSVLKVVSVRSKRSFTISVGESYVPMFVETRGRLPSLTKRGTGGRVRFWG